jgi:uncharacterized SAM-binding protein YcdF (DUF218 family)
MLFIMRTLESLLYPIGFVWLCITVLAIALWRKKARRAGGACALLSVFVYLGGATPIPEHLISRLERPFANATAATAARADVVIVLGGNLSPSAHDSFEISLNSSADRIVTGVEVLRLKKVGAMIFSGGPAGIGTNRMSEGKRVVNWLNTWNVASGEIIGLAPCLNTHDEALRVREVMAERHWTNAIRVTSAYHLPRALATFRKQGIDVRPVACDFEGLPVMERDIAGIRLVPLLERLKILTLYVHEVIGWYYYAARGWI